MIKNVILLFSLVVMCVGCGEKVTYTKVDEGMASPEKNKELSRKKEPKTEIPTFENPISLFYDGHELLRAAQDKDDKLQWNFLPLSFKCSGFGHTFFERAEPQFSWYNLTLTPILTDKAIESLKNKIAQEMSIHPQKVKLSVAHLADKYVTLKSDKDIFSIKSSEDIFWRNPLSEPAGGFSVAEIYSPIPLQITVGIAAEPTVRDTLRDASYNNGLHIGDIFLVTRGVRGLENIKAQILIYDLDKSEFDSGLERALNGNKQK